VTLDIAELAGLRVQAEWVMLEKRGDGASWRRAWNDRDRWHPKWSKAFMELFTRFDQQYNFQLLVKRGLDAWSPGRLKRKPGSVPPASAISAVMQTQVAADQFQDGAMAVYMDLALNEAEAAGQRTLEALGLNETFAWANIRDFPENPYAVRGLEDSPEPLRQPPRAAGPPRARQDQAGLPQDNRAADARDTR
jgi:hypothetical protein